MLSISNIKNKMQKYLDQLNKNNLTKKNIFEKNIKQINKKINKQNNVINKNFTRNLATNAIQSKNQNIFNLIVNITIQEVITLLGEKSFAEKFDELKKNPNLPQNYKNILSLITIKEKINKMYQKNTNNVDISFYYKFIYILFIFIAIQRNIINFIQTNNKVNEFGQFSNKFCDGVEYKMRHLLIGRLKNYKYRIIHNLNEVLKTLKQNDINNEIYTDKIYLKKNKMCIFYNIKLKEKIYFFTSIYILFGSKIIIYIKDKYTNSNVILNYFNDIYFDNNNIQFNHEKYKYYLLIKNINNFPLGIEPAICSISSDLFDRIQCNNIISICLYYLEIEENIIDSKYYIIVIYYTIIFLMPFERGTSSIAEIFLYSLWEKYIGTKLKINHNILLDVEAMSLTFDLFLHNCLNKQSEEDIYTPYFL